MKRVADDIDEFYAAKDHTDPSANRITALISWPPAVAQAVVEAMAGIVQIGHAIERRIPTPAGDLVRAQVFEEGDVYMSEEPFEGYFADRYIMDFYDVNQRDICSRMHVHTGLRFVRMMTGNDTVIRVSSLTPFQIGYSPGWNTAQLEAFDDENPDEDPEVHLRRYNAVVPPNAWVDMQVPRGVSHQFNANGPNAVIDSVHPEESIETLREHMAGYRMMAQTIFLAEHRPAADTCALQRS